MCLRCDELEEEVAYLKSELGLSNEVQDYTRMRTALRKGGGRHTGVATGLIAALCAAKGRTLSKWALMEAVPPTKGGGADDERHPKIIDVWVCSARKALGHDAIENVWGRGYRMTDVGMARVRSILAGDQSHTGPFNCERAGVAT